MYYEKGDVLLIKFPFTSQENLYHISRNDIAEGSLKLESYVKHDKCFTLNSKIVEKN